MIFLFYIAIGTLVSFVALIPKGPKFEAEQRVNAYQDLRSLRK